MPVKREILYPIFLECCEHADDVFWESIFEELAYGKTPYGTYISKGFLCCSYKGKEFSYKIERKDSRLIYDEIYQLLTEKIGILSYKEKAQKKLVFHELERNIKQSRQEWSSIRKKNIKDVMYERYVIDMKNKYLLSVKQCRYLLAVITVAIMCKTITTKDIVYKDDKILSIDGIDFSNGKVIMKRPLCTFDNEIADSPDIEDFVQTNSMAENWNKYLDFLRQSTL